MISIVSKTIISVLFFIVLQRAQALQGMAFSIRRPLQLGISVGRMTSSPSVGRMTSSHRRMTSSSSVDSEDNSLEHSALKEAGERAEKLGNILGISGTTRHIFLCADQTKPKVNMANYTAISLHHHRTYTLKKDKIISYNKIMIVQ